MKDFKKGLIILIVLVLIIVIVLAILLIKTNKNNENTQNNDNIEEIELDEYGNALDTNVKQYDDKFSPLIGKNYYFSIKGCIEDYLKNIKRINDNNEKIKAIESIKNMLDAEYKNKFKITDELITQKAGEFNNTSYEICLKEINVAQITNNELIFLVDGELSKNEFKMLIKFDEKNSTYSIFLDDYIENNGYRKDMNSDDIKVSTNEIEKNNNNAIKFEIINDEQMSKEYFNIIKYYIKNNEADLYEKLETQYKKKMFNTYERFKIYIQELKLDIENSKILSYNVKHDTEYDIYTIVDSNNISYTVQMKESVLDYNLKIENNME